MINEDAAQSIGSKYHSENGKTYKAGAMGTYGCYSFFPSKNLGCMGDGGMVVTNDPQKYEKLKQLRNHGEVTRYHHQFIGGNFRIDALQAAILRLKLPLLDDQHNGRVKNATFYNKALKNRPRGGSAPKLAPGGLRGAILDAFWRYSNYRD